MGGHRHMVGETVSVERWGAQTYVEAVSVERWGPRHMVERDSGCRGMAGGTKLLTQGIC